MGWLAGLLGLTPQWKPVGIRLDTSQPFWELDGRTDFPHLLRALNDLLPEGCTLYFEGGSPNKALLAFFKTREVPEQSHVAVAAWPKPVYHHVPATAVNLSELARIAGSYAEPELAIHFHVYRNAEVVLQWYDAFADPMFLSGVLPENKVRAFAATLGMTVKKRESPTE